VTSDISFFSCGVFAPPVLNIRDHKLLRPCGASISISCPT
jgi:hypothetical protein